MALNIYVKEFRIEWWIFMNDNLNENLEHYNNETSLHINDQNLKNSLLPHYENTDIGIWSFDLVTDTFLVMTKGIENISGYAKEILEKEIEWVSLVHPDDLPNFLENKKQLENGQILREQYRIIDKYGQVKWLQDYTIPTIDRNGKLIKIDGITSDITEQKLLEDKLKFLSEYDPYTNLPNRRKFFETLERRFHKYEDRNRKFAVMIIDMDRFKFINDTLGHEIADELFKEVAFRINTLLSPDDLLARYGEDEFAVLIDTTESIESITTIAERMINAFKEPFYIENYQLYATANIGVSTFPENGNNSIELLRNANLALYKSQKAGKNKYHIISHLSSIQSFKSFSLGRDLKKALENNEMVLHFQPRVDAFTNEIISAEALIRWNHPEWGIISPIEFLTIAEENGFIEDVDNWVLNEVCHQMKLLRERKILTVPISINISAVHFSVYNWQEKVASIIESYGIHSKDLEFEITESLLLNNDNSVQDTLNALKSLGIKIVLDDFGTGYSSLSYLTHFPFDIIKIDKSFTKNMVISEKDLFIVKSIIFMAKGLNIKVVAEGVETLEQLKLLQEEQCDEIQGYLFSKPVPIEEFISLLKKKTLKPIDPSVKGAKNKRKYNRIELPYPIEAEMRLVSFAGQALQLGKSHALIQNVSIGGLRFITNLNLPVRGDIHLQFDTEILDQAIRLIGKVIWKEEMKEDLFVYGIEFIQNDEKQASFKILLDQLSDELKKDNGVSLKKIIKGEITVYFNKKKKFF